MKRENGNFQFENQVNLNEKVLEGRYFYSGKGARENPNVCYPA